MEEMEEHKKEKRKSIKERFSSMICGLELNEKKSSSEKGDRFAAENELKATWRGKGIWG